MPKAQSKRMFERHLHETPIMFTCSSNQPFCYYGAKMLNHSVGGGYIESLYPMEPGSIIYFNRAAYTLGDYGPDTYKPHCVVVKWCRELPREGTTHYGIGVQFVDPAACELTGNEEIRPVASDAPDAAVAGTTQSLPVEVKIDPDFTISERQLKRAMEVAESRANKLAVLNQFAVRIGSTLDLDEILQSVCREMCQVFGARNTGIGLLDRYKTKITLVAFHAIDPGESDATGMDIPLEGNGATHRVVETGQTIVVPDVQRNPLTGSLHEIARVRGTECLMIVPLLTRGKVIGTIGMPTVDKDRVFTTEEVSLAQTIASQIASAVENARLFGKTEKAKEIAENDLEIGRKIQTEFFPEKLPVIPGWEIATHFQPARKVSGDFYDIFPISGGHCLGLVIADVCDHGVGAALFMVLFRSLVRAYAEPSFQECEGCNLSDTGKVETALVETIRRTNTYIATTHERSGMFATMFFGVLNLETGLLSYINCGHEAPLILCDKGVETSLKPTGPAVGLDADHTFSVGHVRMDPYQVMFFYTDGVPDTQNQEGQHFTKNRLMDLLEQSFPSAEALIQNVNTQLQNHVAGADLYDDVTLMAIRRT